MALKEAYTQATEFFDRVMESVKLSGPMQNKFLETIIGLAKDLGISSFISLLHLCANYETICLSILIAVLCSSNYYITNILFGMKEPVMALCMNVG